jgi:hypothetical protein
MTEISTRRLESWILAVGGHLSTDRRSYNENLPRIRRDRAQEPGRGVLQNIVLPAGRPHG